MKLIGRVLLAAVIMGGVLVYVWERVEIVRVGYQIERLKAKRVVLQREHDELQVKLSALSAPERLARVANERLGLVPPRHGQVVMVKVQSSTSPIQAPTVASLRLAKYASKESRP